MGTKQVQRKQMRFSGKRVVLTGGSTGIGRATAKAFAEEGAAVMIGDIDLRAEETVREIEQAGGHAAFMKVDVSDRLQAAALFAACVERFGGLDVGFNNAGVLPPTLPLHEMPEAEFDRVFAIDVKGVFNMLQAEICHMLQSGGGAIVNTASVAGVIADPGMAPYAAAKHAVVGLTKSAALDYARKGHPRECSGSRLGSHSDDRSLVGRPQVHGGISCGKPDWPLRSLKRRFPPKRWSR